MFLVELLLELVVQLVVEIALEGLARLFGRVFAHPTVRLVLGVGAVLGAGYAGGYWWGHRLSEAGRVDEPHSLWVSLVLAVAFITAAAVRLRRDDRDVATRLSFLALLNCAVAAGIAVGFTPQP